MSQNQLPQVQQRPATIGQAVELETRTAGLASGERKSVADTLYAKAVEAFPIADGADSVAVRTALSQRIRHIQGVLPELSTLLVVKTEGVEGVSETALLFEGMSVSDIASAIKNAQTQVGAELGA